MTISHHTLPTPPPDETDQDATAAEEEKQKKLEEWRHFNEDVTLDFAAFEGSIARIQFLFTSNEKERERYAAEKDQILDTMQSVRENTGELRVQLEEAQRLLALRKSYDDLADKIIGNRLLKPREDQQANLQKLEAEITDLEHESTEYAKTWAERREQFGRIVDEGLQLRRLIRDEKEEVERREGMQEGEEGDEGDAGSKGKSSEMNTPRPERDSSMTPGQQSLDEASRSKVLQADRTGTTRGVSPLRQVATPEGAKAPAEQEDANMVDEGEVTGQDELEEGEAVPDDSTVDKMDTT